MNHCFNTTIAELYGLQEAILLENIYFWCKKNEANNKLTEGEPWTYNTVKAFNTQFKYLSPAVITRALKNLEKSGLIKIGEFNTNAYDHTKWYCITDKCRKYFEDDSSQEGKTENRSENNNSICEFSKSKDENNNSITKKEQILITDIITNIITDNNTNTHTDTDECAERHPLNIGELQNEMYAAVTEHNKRSPPEKKIAVSPSLLGFCQKEFREMLDIIGIDTVRNSPQMIISALRNYLEVAEMNSWKKYFSLRSFFRDYLDFVPEFFAASRYIDETKDSTEPGKRPQDLFYFSMKDNPRFDASIFRRHWDDWLKTRPKGEDYFKWQNKWEDINAY